MNEPAGYLCVFDRRVTDAETLQAIQPSEPWPARFVSLEVALDCVQRFKDRKPGEVWSIFDGAIPMFIGEVGKAHVNPLWEESPFEVRIVANDTDPLLTESPAG